MTAAVLPCRAVLTLAAREFPASFPVVGRFFGKPPDESFFSLQTATFREPRQSSTVDRFLATSQFRCGFSFGYEWANTTQGWLKKLWGFPACHIIGFQDTQAGKPAPLNLPSPLNDCTCAQSPVLLRGQRIVRICNPNSDSEIRRLHHLESRTSVGL